MSAPAVGSIRLARAALLVVLAMEAAALALPMVPPHDAVTPSSLARWPFLAWALAASLVLHLASRPARLELAAAAAAAVACLAATWPRVPLIQLPAAAGLGSLAALGVRAVLQPAQSSRLALCALPPLLVLPTYSWLDLQARWFPDVYDLHLYAFDAGYGLQPSFAVTRLVYTLPVLRALIATVYFGLPVAAALAIAARRQDAAPGARLLSQLAVAGLAGYALYMVVPAVGPAAAFGPFFPNRPPEAPVAVTAPGLNVRNAMPSLHLAWALLIAWSTRGLPRVSLAAAAFVVLTAIGALVNGPHYLVDLVVAFPFAVAVRALSSTAPWSTPERCRALVLCSVLCASWLLLLRLAPALFAASVGLTWGVSLATVAASSLLEAGLARRETAPPPR